MESFVMSFASMLLALGVVLAIAWLALSLLRSRMQPRGTPRAAAPTTRCASCARCRWAPRSAW